ncbi:RING-H2 finger protein ATL72 [Zea mays]|jgi:E3 ubiquitin-protein ligase ATL10/75/76/77/78|uniref:RING-H2 finger protein ATL79 n=1 Tax=Zea mays TaxID=4577 RepID=A0A1D6N6H5_MAIZE|nr:RING-H2 finger protein ATL72 [Zea mays]ONM36199.1 RING-H2 finger protein ATL79 [Zea mays]|eukprot:XP_008674782.1 RING-H2 finger protein ATL72 [Zea mays]
MSVEQLHARKLLSHAAAAAAASSAGPPATEAQVPAAHAHAAAPFSSLNTMVITALSLLLCGLVVVLAVHAVVRCAFRVTRRVCYGQDEESPGGGGGGGADASAAAASFSCQAGPRRKRGPRTGLPPWILYSREVELTGCGAAECAICLTEFVRGDRVRALPHCNHGFHVRCIDRWLAARQTCPTCRRAPFAAKPSLSLPDSAEAPESVQLQARVESGAGQHETQ